MNIGLLNILKTVSWDFRRDMAQSYANALKNAIELHIPNDKELRESFFLSKKGSKTARGGFEDKLYVGNIHRIENHLYWNDEELADDDQIVNVVVIDGPVTRDGGGCSYGTKDFRDQVEYANTIPQVVFHLFLVNTPGGESACRNDYDEMFRSCREAGKPTVWYVDGQCCSSGVNGGCRADRVIVRNPKDDFGCIGSMAAFWATPDGAIDRDGTRYIEIVGDESPDKNDWYREAAQGNYEKLREMINKDTEEFHQTVRENRPLVEDWMLTGKVFEAQELIPALVDEIGDFDRAIECGFELAEGRLQSAREATVVKEPEEEPEGEQPEGSEPEDKAQDDQVREAAVVQQHTEQESINPNKHNNDMTEEEKKAAEVAEQPAATQEETPAAEQPAEEASATEAPAATDDSQGSELEETDESPAQEEPAVTEQPSDDTVEEATVETNRITATLHAAEALVADRDKEIAKLKEVLATLNGIAEERDAAVKERNDISASLEKAGLDYAEQGKKLTDAEAKVAAHAATIETLKKQVADLKAELKELAGKPAPMTDGAAGTPQDNGTGEPPAMKLPWEQRVKRGMSYEEVMKTKNG